jgi:hypothetical protein
MVYNNKLDPFPTRNSEIAFPIITIFNDWRFAERMVLKKTMKMIILLVPWKR